MNRTQHPSNNGILGAPKGTPIEVCGALPVTNIRYADGTEAVVSYWEPTRQELLLLATGAPVRVAILGKTHPPIKLGVDGDGDL